MKVTVVEAIPRRGGRTGNKYLPLLNEFADNEPGTCAILEEVPIERAAYLKTIRCNNELPINIVTRKGTIYLERLNSFDDLK